MILLVNYLPATEIEEQDSEKTQLEQLHQIAIDMTDMQEKLMEHRTDTTVQIQGKDIDDRLEKLIKLVEGRRVKKEFWNKMNGTGKPPPDMEGKVINHQDYISKFSEFIHLKGIKRDELTQVWNSELPLKWKTRIEAYFISIASEK